MGYSGVIIKEVTSVPTVHVGFGKVCSDKILDMAIPYRFFVRSIRVHLSEKVDVLSSELVGSSVAWKSPIGSKKKNA